MIVDGESLLEAAGRVSDVMGCASLLVLAAVFGLPSFNTVGNTFLRKRGEIALIFAIASCGRALHYYHLDYLHEMQRIILGCVTTLTAAMAVFRVAWGKVHVR